MNILCCSPVLHHPLPPCPNLWNSDAACLCPASALPSQVMVPALVPEEAARTTPTAPRQTLTWGESLAGSHAAPKSPGLPNCKRKGSKKARFTGQGFRDARSCSSPFPWNQPSCPVQCVDVHTWMETHGGTETQ